MSKIIKDGSLVADDWHLFTKECEIPAADAIGSRSIVPMSFWLENREVLKSKNQLGVWIDSDEDVEAIAEDIHTLPLLAVNFPGFMDGRAFSTARIVRDRYEFKGELRAIGGFIRDQLTYLKRCGVNAFQSDSLDLEVAVASLNDFSESYQAACDQPKPLFLRR
ncbi:MAG: DUF934 domain-containing protein [Cellvibrionaceae bacterium]